MKKQKQKRILTRRQSALRAAVITLAGMVFMVHVMHLGLIFPVQTVWQLEERAGIEHTRVVKRSPAPEIHRTHLAFLSENDDATLFSSCNLTAISFCQQVIFNQNFLNRLFRNYFSFFLKMSNIFFKFCSG